MAEASVPRRAGRRRRARPAGASGPPPPASGTELRFRRAYALGAITVSELADLLASLDDGEDEAPAGLPPLPPGSSPGNRPPPADTGLLARLAAITDPLERFTTAARVTDSAKAEQETARQHRNIAAVSAHVRYGVVQEDCYRAYTTRRHYRDTLRQVSAALPVYADPPYTVSDIDRALAGKNAPHPLAGLSRRELEWLRDRIPVRDNAASHGTEGAAAALAAADLQHARYERARREAETARMVRDREVRALTGGEYGPYGRVSNADLARAAGYSTALIAQIRRSPA